MRTNDREASPVLLYCFIAVLFFGMLFWTVRIADAWDSKMGRMVAQIDLLMEKAYGAATRE
jgi:hypothetical protein